MLLMIDSRQRINHINHYSLIILIQPSMFNVLDPALDPIITLDPTLKHKCFLVCFFRYADELMQLSAKHVHECTGTRRALMALMAAEQNATTYGASTALVPGRNKCHVNDCDCCECDCVFRCCFVGAECLMLECLGKY